MLRIDRVYRGANRAAGAATLPRGLLCGRVSDEVKEEVETQFVKGLKSLAQLARFEPFIAQGVHSRRLCRVGASSADLQSQQKIYAGDFLENFVPVAMPYRKTISERPQVLKVSTNRSLAMEALVAQSRK